MNALTPVPVRNKKAIYTYENLSRYVNLDESLMNPAMKAARTRYQNGDSGYYGYLPQQFPLHYRAFRNMHDKELSVDMEVSLTFDMTPLGLMNFIIELGPIPSNLHHPIVARINPDLGFVAGNIRWVNEKKFRPECARRALEIANSYR